MPVRCVNCSGEATTGILVVPLALTTANGMSLGWTNLTANREIAFGGTVYSQGRRADLSGRTRARLAVARHAASGNVLLSVQYTTDGAAWKYLDGTADNASAGIGSAGPQINASTASTLYVGDWAPLDDAAKTTVWLRVVASGGNGTDDPNFGAIYLEAE